jgi:hypothetical protein
MEKSQLQIDLEQLIARKIKARNKVFDKTPDKIELIKWYDAELDLLEKIEQYYEIQRQTFSKILLRAKIEAFENGFKSGKISERTGRDIHISYN